MYLKTIYFYFVISIFIKYVIVDVVGIGGNDPRHTNSNLDHTQPKTPTGNNVRRSLQDLLAQLRKEIRERIRNQRPFERYFFQNTPPIVSILSYYVFLNVIHYGTEYDTVNKIPVYSAYKLDLNLRRTPGRIAPWFKYPYLSDKAQPIIKKGLKNGSSIGDIYILNFMLWEMK